MQDHSAGVGRHNWSGGLCETRRFYGFALNIRVHKASLGSFGFAESIVRKRVEMAPWPWLEAILFVTL